MTASPVTASGKGRHGLLHMATGEKTAWTSVNIAEAMPGVQTPLGWTFWRDACERGIRKAFWRMGAFTAGNVQSPAPADDRFFAVFHGRVAGNVLRFRDLGDRLPGTSGDAVEEQIFGVRRTAELSRPHWRRYPVAAVKLSWSARRSVRRLHELRQAIDGWWGSAVRTPPDDVASARRLFAEAMVHFEAVMGWHALVTMLAQACFEQVAGLAEAAGVPAGALTAGYGSTEVALIEDLWCVAHGRLELDGFLTRHGYHGPAEGEMSSRSWREDPAPIRALLPGYADVAFEERPVARAADLAARRRRAEAELLARCGAAKRPGAKVILRLARTYVPLRETGKAAFLQAIDAARLAARTVGVGQVAAGTVTSADDIFFFTVEELLGEAPPSRSTIGERRTDHERFLGQTLPAAWIGPPEAQPLVASGPVPPGDGPVTGMGVSPGTAEGTVRVLSDPSLGVDFAPGDILVCEATDPGWASLMFLASALVVDIGGAMSHAAIIARELGVPCVVNTGDGTRRLRTGERVRVDGTTGAVHVLAGGQQR